MTAFLTICAAMVVVAVGWIVWPLLRSDPSGAASGTRAERRLLAVTLALILPLAAAGLYAKLSTWKWDDPQLAEAMAMRKQLNSLEARLRAQPADIEGWQLLGRSYLSLGQMPQAVNAFEKAHALAGGRDPDISAALAEALVLSDESALKGRAGQLLDQALTLAPTHPKALFYGSLAAMQDGRLLLARERLQNLLAQNPPAQIRPALERQIQDLTDQIDGNKTATDLPRSSRVVRVSVALAPQVKAEIKEPLTLFIIASDASGDSPPLAVERHSSNDLPLTVELDQHDSIMASRNIGGVSELQIVARLSRSGAPQQQSGDYFGEVRLHTDPHDASQEFSVNVTIDRRAP